MKKKKHEYYMKTIKRCECTKFPVSKLISNNNLPFFFVGSGFVSQLIVNNMNHI